jgi:hypothetical protein
VPNKKPNYLTLRATPTDLAQIRAIADYLRGRLGLPFVSRAEAIRFALTTAMVTLPGPAGEAPDAEVSVAQ